MVQQIEYLSLIHTFEIEENIFSILENNLTISNIDATNLIFRLNVR
jgi:hypothetical protein